MCVYVMYKVVYNCCFVKFMDFCNVFQVKILEDEDLSLILK